MAVGQAYFSFGFPELAEVGLGDPCGPFQLKKSMILWLCEIVRKIFSLVYYLRHGAPTTGKWSCLPHRSALRNFHLCNHSIRSWPCPIHNNYNICGWTQDYVSQNVSLLGWQYLGFCWSWGIINNQANNAGTTWDLMGKILLCNIVVV